MSSDFSGNMRHAFWFQSGLFSTDGVFGSKAYYNSLGGASRHFNIITDGVNGDKMSVAFWVRTSVNLAPISGADFRFLESGNYLFYLDDGDAVRLSAGSSGLIKDGLTWPADSWHHVAAVLSSGNNQLWLDGALVDSNVLPVSVFYSDIFAVNKDFGIEAFGDVTTDEFAIWNRALNPDEIQNLSQGNRIRTGSIESDWIDLGGTFNSLNISLTGVSTETMTTFISCDGVNWNEVEHGKWVNYYHHDQLVDCTQVKYRIRFSGGDSNTNLDGVNIEWSIFAEDPEAFTFVVYGDARTFEISHQRVMRRIERIDPLFTFHTGDYFTNPQYGAQYEIKSLLRTTAEIRERKPVDGLNASYYGVIGNHERPAPYHEYFDAFNYSPMLTSIPADPNNPILADDGINYYNQYYSFKYRNACFISLNYYDYDEHRILGTNIDGTSDLQAPAFQGGYAKYSAIPINVTDLSKATFQYKWLYSVLEDCQNDPNIDWKFVFIHYPPFSTGSHGDGDPKHQPQGARKHISTLLEYFDVDVVFNGHDHDYERFVPVKIDYNVGAVENARFNGVQDNDGVTYIVTGAGGGPQSAWPIPADTLTAYREAGFSSTRIIVNGTKLDGGSLRVDDNWFDPFSITKSVAQPPANVIYVDDNLAGDCLAGNYNITSRQCDGSDGLAFTSIIEASNNVTAGYTVLIRGGTYNKAISRLENDVIWPKQSGTPQNPITFKPYNGEIVILGNAGYQSYPNDDWASIARGVITINGTHDIVIDGLRIEQVAGWVYARYCSNITMQNMYFNNATWSGKGGAKFIDCDHNKVINTTFMNSMEDSLSFVASNYNLVEGNTFNSAQHALIAVRCGNFNVFRNNTLRNPWFDNGLAEKLIEIYDCRVDYRDPANPSYIDPPQYDNTKYNLIENNHFGYHPFMPNHGAQSSAIQFSAQNTIIRNNIFSNPLGVSDPQYPLGLSGGPALSIRWGGSWTGWFCNANGCSLVGEGIEAGFVSHNRVFHNVFYGYDNAHVIVPSKSAVNNLPNPPPMKNVQDYWNYNFSRMYDFSDNVFKNNIFYDTNFTAHINWGDYKNNDGTPTQLMIRGATNSPSSTNIGEVYFENNNFFSTGNNFGQNIYDHGHYSYTPPKSSLFFNTNHPQSFVGNIQQDPDFIDNVSFELRAGSNMIDSGAFLTNTTGAGSGNVIQLQDVGYFYDGFGISGEQGDLIQLRGQTQTARILSINYGTNTLTLDRTLAWNSGQGVGLVYSGSAPDIGAYEYNPGTTSCISQGELNIELKKFVDMQTGIVPVSNKVIEYLGC